MDIETALDRINNFLYVYDENGSELEIDQVIGNEARVWSLETGEQWMPLSDLYSTPLDPNC